MILENIFFMAITHRVSVLFILLHSIFFIFLTAYFSPLTYFCVPALNIDLFIQMYHTQSIIRVL